MSSHMFDTARSAMEESKELTRKAYPIPRCVQELFPVLDFTEDGIFRLEDAVSGEKVLYDKAYFFPDTNFTALDEAERKKFLKAYCQILNAMPVSFKIVLMNNDLGRETVRREVCLPEGEEPFQELSDSFNRSIWEKVEEGGAGILRRRVFLLSARAGSFEEARSYFEALESSLRVSFERLGSGLQGLSATERFALLYELYHLSEKEEAYSFDPRKAKSCLSGWKGSFLPWMIWHSTDENGAPEEDTLRIDNHFCRLLYLRQMPSAIDPDALMRTVGGAKHVTLTIDCAPVPQAVARRMLENLRLGIGRTIEKQQEMRNRIGAWSSDISWDVRKARDECESYLDILTTNGENIIYTGIYAMITAPSRAELERAAISFTNTALGEGLVFQPAYVRQIEAMNTAFPIGCRFMDSMHPIFTQPLCGFTPFSVSELCQPGGFYYGSNRISGSLISGDRKKLLNANGFVLGVPGSGKSVQVKLEMIQAFLRTEDDIIVIDPQNEYRALAEHLGGQFIDFSARAGHHINPLDTDLFELGMADSVRAFIQDKTELLISIFAQITEYSLNAQHKSVIGRVVNRIYEEVGDPGFQTPTLLDFYRLLLREPESQARNLALDLELFVRGGLDMFARPTNVDSKGRFTVYGILDLGKEQSAVGMLIMLESIRSRIAQNAREGKATWLYVDEFHNLASREYSARYLEKIWKEVRKLGGLCTAITQNIADLLTSKTIETMLCNSEYLSLLTQSEVENAMLHRLLGIPERMLDHVRAVPKGCGILKFGDRLIPVDGRISKDTVLYELLNTDFHEIQMRASGRSVRRDG